MPMIEYVNCSDAIPLVEQTTWNNKPLTYIIRREVDPSRTTFLTPPEFKQQVGYIVYPADGEVPRHLHRDLERHLVGTSEVLIVSGGDAR
jgi:hypothetical protein